MSPGTSEVKVPVVTWSNAGLYQCVSKYPGFEDSYSAEPATLSVRGKREKREREREREREKRERDIKRERERERDIKRERERKKEKKKERNREKKKEREKEGEKEHDTSLFQKGSILTFHGIISRVM